MGALYGTSVSATVTLNTFAVLSESYGSSQLWTSAGDWSPRRR